MQLVPPVRGGAVEHWMFEAARRLDEEIKLETAILP